MRLGKTLEGKVILMSASKNKINRRHLSKFLIEEKMGKDFNKKITKGELEKMATEVVDAFPFERKEIYFIPSRMINDKKNSAKGVLYDHYCNKRKKLIKLGLIGKCIAPEQTTENVTRELSTNEQEDMSWLSNSIEPWHIVLDKWRSTLAGRLQVMKDKTIQDILDNFPPYKHHLGFSLVENDFKSMFQGKNNNFFLNWPLKRSKLLDILISSNMKEIKTCVNQFPADEVANNDILPLFLLPLYFPSKKIRNTSWRPSKIEIQEGFILFVKNVTDIKPNLLYKRNKYETLKLSMQPIPIFVGGSYINIEKSFVSVSDILWEVQSPLHAIDICFKCYHVFGTKYPVESDMIWLFIQQTMYDIYSTYDTDYVSVKSLQCEIK